MEPKTAGGTEARRAREAHGARRVYRARGARGQVTPSLRLPLSSTVCGRPYFMRLPG